MVYTRISLANHDITLWVCLGIATLFVVMRLAIRIKMARRLLEDDYAVIFAYAAFVGMTICFHIMLPPLYELMQLTAAPTAEQIPRIELYLRVQFAVLLVFFTVLWAVKISFLLFFRRLLAGVQGRKMWYWYFVLGFVILAYIGCWATQLDACRPVSGYFHLGTCNTPRDTKMSGVILKYAASVDILSDVFIMCVPLTLLYGLQISTQQKVGLAGIFSLGTVIIVFAIIRVVETNPGTSSIDPIWVTFWSDLEACVSMVVVCLPSLRTFFGSAPLRKTGYLGGGGGVSGGHYGNGTTRKGTGFGRSTTGTMNGTLKSQRGHEFDTLASHTSVAKIGRHMHHQQSQESVDSDERGIFPMDKIQVSHDIRVISNGRDRDMV